MEKKEEISKRSFEGLSDSSDKKQEPKEKKEEIKETIEKLKKAIKKDVSGTDPKDAKINELTDSLQRLQADFENYRRLVEKQKKEFIEYAHSDLIEKLLPILDSFELALKNKDKQEDFVKGVELIFAQLYQLLEKEGLRKIEADGKKFDPYKHEVLMTEKSGKEEDIILEELQKGYMLCSKVIRHSKVKVSKK